MKEISSPQHPLVKHLTKLRQNRDYRQELGLVLVEGVKPISELAEIKTVLVSHPEKLPGTVRAKEVILVTDEIIKKISGMQHPEGIIAESYLPKPADLRSSKWIVALDGLSEPGNVGALLRTALALGFEGAFLLGDGCDPFNDKALRAARGATFRLPIRQGHLEELLELTKENNLPLFAADTRGTPLSEIPALTGAVLILGNEAHGPSKETLQAAKPITIPMSGDMESLNVAAAGAILMHHLRGTP